MGAFAEIGISRLALTAPIGRDLVRAPHSNSSGKLHCNLTGLINQREQACVLGEGRAARPSAAETVRGS